MINTTLEKHVIQLLHDHPTSRILSFSYQCTGYFIKRCLPNGRNSFAKTNPVTAFLAEAYKITAVNSRLPLAPTIVLWGPDYFVMKDCGKTLQRIAKEDEWIPLRQHVFFEAGKSLALLHQAGLHHGRPALRDIAFHKETNKITFLDWENEKRFFHIQPETLDILLFIHSCFREECSSLELLDAAVTGYLSIPSSHLIWENLKQFIHAHSALFTFCHYLSAFHWIDVVSLDKAHQYIETHA